MSAAEALKLIEQAAAEQWTELDLSGMNLDELPPEIGKLEKLETLILGKWDDKARTWKGNNLKTLPKEITKLHNITHLDLSSNAIQALPESITELTKLTKLYLSENHIQKLSLNFINFRNLEILDLGSNQIKDFPEIITHLIGLTELNLRSNQIEEIPDSSARLINLVKLNIGDNYISDFNESFTKLKRMTQLNLRSNKITKIPHSISDLSNLTQLDLRANKILEIPNTISDLSNLTQLILSRNKIETIPETIKNLKNLKYLDLQKNRIELIPDTIGELTNLIHLNLGHNRIKKIPKTISGLKNLPKLQLIRNRITEIPSEIRSLTKLEKIHLSSNQIEIIPRTISGLKSLTEIHLGFNEIQSIPDTITELVKLSHLELKDNRISHLPNSINNLASLTHLDISDNEIEIIPREIIDLKRLTHLDISDNQIKEIPEEIFTLKGLKEFHIIPNPIENIPQEILAQGNENILNFLRQGFLKERKPLHEAKMLLVGQGNVGKTSLINRLIRDEFDKEESQTDGLNVQDWNIHVNSKDIRLNVWDFGGQEIYHATHQFFLTKRSLYLLVCNCRTSEEENRLEYWLKLIQTFGDASPVIIVGNKKDEQPLDINRKALRTKYPNICAILETSCQSGDGIKELSETIHQQVAKLKEVYDLLPLSWFEVKEQLEAMTEDFITYNRYIGICHENKIPEEHNQDQLIDLLHRLGLVLNFREHPIFKKTNHLLQQTSILKPEWATEGIYALLSDDRLKTKSKGIFSCDDLTRILDAARYPKERHQYLIELMKEFELSFALDCNPPRFLIPGILPKDEPEATDLEGDTLEFQYHYRVLPNSIISRFIVKTHEKIHNETYWRSGVMLAYKEGNETCNIARIKSDPEDNKIFIAIGGKPETRRIFLGLIRDVFNKIHKSFGNLEISEWVPVPGHPEHVLKYSDLLGLEEMGETHKVIGELKLRLELRKLLDGYESRESRQKSAGSYIEQQTNYYQYGKGDNVGRDKR